MDMSLNRLRELVMDIGAAISWGRKESDTTEQLNWTEKYIQFTEKRYTGIYELERKTKSKSRAVHRIYAKSLFPKFYSHNSKLFWSQWEKKRGKAVTYKIHHAHGIKQALGQR